MGNPVRASALTYEQAAFPTTEGLRHAFTLVEVLVAAALAALVLWGVLATNLQLMGSGVRITHFAEMQSQKRRALDQFGRDVKIASAITWNGASDITLTVPTSAGTTAQVTYAWNSATGAFFAVPGASSAITSGRVILVQGISALPNGSPGLTFARFDRDGAAATNDLVTKRIQVSMTIGRQTRMTAVASEDAVSATFTLRNKPIE